MFFKKLSPAALIIKELLSAKSYIPKYYFIKPFKIFFYFAMKTNKMNLVV
jgi:hypothetical protein